MSIQRLSQSRQLHPHSLIGAHFETVSLGLSGPLCPCTLDPVHTDSIPFHLTLTDSIQGLADHEVVGVGGTLRHLSQLHSDLSCSVLRE